MRITFPSHMCFVVLNLFTQQLVLWQHSNLTLRSKLNLKFHICRRQLSDCRGICTPPPSPYLEFSYFIKCLGYGLELFGVGRLKMEPLGFAKMCAKKSTWGGGGLSICFWKKKGFLENRSITLVGQNRQRRVHVFVILPLHGCCSMRCINCSEITTAYLLYIIMWY